MRNLFHGKYCTVRKGVHMAAGYTTIYLYGNAFSCEKARLLLEDLPQVKQINASSLPMLRLRLCAPLHEKSLIPLLAQSGISGFRLI